MKRSGILNQALSEAIASLGHGEIMMIVDAGFPIARDAWRIDLAIVPGTPSLETLYRAIAPEVIVEKVMFAAELAEHNGPLYRTLQTWFDIRDFAPVPYEETVGALARKAKFIVRSGAFDPWGNIALQAGIDVPAYFSDATVGVPERYAALRGRTPFTPGQGVPRDADPSGKPEP